MNKLYILYLYGWNGGPHSKGLIAVQEAGLDAEVVSWHYDQIDPRQNYADAQELVEGLIKKGTLLVIGNSLGGYWANTIAEEFKLEAILINPSLSPMDTLGKYGKVSEENLAAYKPSTFNHKNKWIYLSKYDTVIDPHIAEKIFEDCNGTTWLDEEHAIQDYTFLIEKVTAWIEEKKVELQSN